MVPTEPLQARQRDPPHPHGRLQPLAAVFSLMCSLHWVSPGSRCVSQWLFSVTPNIVPIFSVKKKFFFVPLYVEPSAAVKRHETPAASSKYLLDLCTAASMKIQYSLIILLSIVQPQTVFRSIVEPPTAICSPLLPPIVYFRWILLASVCLCGEPLLLRHPHAPVDGPSG